MRKLHILMAAGLAGLALGAATSAAAQSASSYLAQAGASDLYERQSAQLALQKSANDDVKKFAQMMIKDHAQSTADLKASAGMARVKVPTPTLNAKQRAMMTTLRPLNGVAFDRAYLEQQRAAHKEALALHQSYARSGDKAALKQAAGKIVPVVEDHIAMIESDLKGGAHEGTNMQH